MSPSRTLDRSLGPSGHIDDFARRNPLVEKFTPPDAAAYGRFLAAAPDYRAGA